MSGFLPTVLYNVLIHRWLRIARAKPAKAGIIVRILRRKWLLRTKKELRKNKKDEEEAKPSSSSFSFWHSKEKGVTPAY
jgi:hypothetical protein